MKWYPQRGLHSQILYNHLVGLTDVFSSHAKVISRGYGGLVIDNQDGTVSKAYFRHNRIRVYKDDVSYMGAEERALRFFEKHKMDEVCVPRIVDEPVYFEGDKKNPFFQGILRISKLKGYAGEWQGIQGRLSAEELSSHMEQAGRVLAEFHRVTQDAPRENIFAVKPWDENFTLTSGYFQDEENNELASADKVIRDSFTSRFVHGDFAGRNLMVSENGNITGLIDFAFSSFGHNLTQDFRGVYYDNPELLPALVQSYNRHSSGVQVTQEHVDLQLLMDHVGFMIGMKKNPHLSEEKWQDSYKRLQNFLDGLSSRQII